MKKLALFVFCAFVFSNSVYSAGLDEKVAPQSFHQVGNSVAQPSNQQTNANSDAAQLAKVKAIMDAAKKQTPANATAKNVNPVNMDDPNGATPPAATLPPTNDTAVANAPVSSNLAQDPLNNSTATKSLQAELSQLNQNQLLFQQAIDQKIALLNNQNQTLSAEVQKLQQALVILNEEMNTLSANFQTIKNEPSSLLETQHLFSWALLIIFILLVVTLIFLVLSRYRPKKEVAQTSAGEADTDNEYDFMNSAEAIPAKFDLVRAYFAMEDFAAARLILEEILKSGNPAQKQEAKDLLSRIPAASSN